MYLVTGGAGFIGSHTVRELLARGCRVKVVDNLSSGSLDNLRDCLDQVEFVKADIRDGSQEHIFQGVCTVLHLAAIASVERSIEDPLETESNNVAGTLNILKLSQANGVKRVVFASTAAVYGDAGSLPLAEDSPVNPLSPYAISKYAGEFYARYYAAMYRIETVSLRYFNVFGPDQDPSSDYSGVITRFFDRMINRKPPVIFGDGLQTRDFVYVDDVVRANLLAAQSTRAGRGEAINIACGRSISIVELAEAINAALGTRYSPLYKEARKGDVRCSLADISKAGEMLGYKPAVGFNEGIHRLQKWRKRNWSA